jgi:predicted DsbA family dithiol-disulfide isomerase
MNDRLFQHRTQLHDALYTTLAAEIGLDPARFRAEMDSRAVRKVVDDDVALARRLGVTGTPTMFLDGRRVNELCQTPLFWEAVARMPPHVAGSSIASCGNDETVPRRSAVEE